MFAYYLQCIRGKTLFLISNNAGHSKKGIHPDSTRAGSTHPRELATSTTCAPRDAAPAQANGSAFPRDATPHDDAPIELRPRPMSDLPRRASPHRARAGLVAAMEEEAERSGPRRPPSLVFAAALWHAQALVAHLRHASSSRGLASTPAFTVRGPSPCLPASLRHLELPPRPPLRQPPSRARCRRVRSRCHIRLPARTRLPALARLHLS
ncbi:hypothetical protein PR202_gb17066 [Eleusine coracana subsp. coracana]|uniref:Uncharacterized protein n=1 Tax=Eleusine coracana subsp. coracana TaxID=191504 RepID=A0AAV5F1Z0_ELECO|nr:hypothetical protein PR202_gb17066 [Eleusine coracana subsp. coracana]